MWLTLKSIFKPSQETLILLIDNFDSFSHNLLDYVKRFVDEVHCIRYDELDLTKVGQHPLSGILIGPGPGKPKDYPLLFELLSNYQDRLPILGICLGHQLIGEYYGATLSEGIQPMHGKVSQITSSTHPMFDGIEKNTQVTRYHSLVLKNLPDNIQETGQSLEDENMAIAHRSKNVWGIQFHPEAVLTTDGEQMIANWVALTVQKQTREAGNRLNSQAVSLNVST